MTYLADANAFIALLCHHEHHDRAHAFFARRPFAASPQVQLAALRFLTAPRNINGEQHPPLETASEALRKVKVACHSRARIFTADSLSITELRFPFLTGHRQWNDFYLVALAKQNGMKLATFETALGELFPDDVKVIP